uniref:Uncharacterized protein n=1 Tax=Sphaerodactylus townsendi TaxID=933632 RepID=A0ACB8G4X0_9SAUR
MVISQLGPITFHGNTPTRSSGSFSETMGFEGNEFRKPGVGQAPLKLSRNSCSSAGTQFRQLRITKPTAKA